MICLTRLESSIWRIILRSMGLVCEGHLGLGCSLVEAVKNLDGLLDSCEPILGFLDGLLILSFLFRSNLVCLCLSFLQLCGFICQHGQLFDELVPSCLLHRHFCIDICQIL